MPNEEETQLTPEEETAVTEADAALEPVPEPVAEPVEEAEPAPEPASSELIQHANGSFEVVVQQPIRNEE
jgi:hypothetical protein